MLIVAVAAFNIISSLLMLVINKQKDIAILMTLGATKANIIKIYTLYPGRRVKNEGMKKIFPKQSLLYGVLAS